MLRYFLDTFYLVALSDLRDQWHARVLAFSQALAEYRPYTVDLLQKSGERGKSRSYEDSQ
jgi:predicted nucleic acid-binding protein